MSLSALFNKFLSPERVFLEKMRLMLGFTPGNIKLYRTAFRHKSVAFNVKNGVKNSNERLEFLGDAVLGLVIAEVLYMKYPFKEEGFLTEMRAKIVNRAHLNQLAEKLGIDQLLAYDAKSISHNNHKQTALLGDAFEALIGAIYLDKGYDAVRRFLLKRIIENHVDIVGLEHTETNFKSKLLEWGQKHTRDILFEVLNKDDEDQKLFTVQVNIDGLGYGVGQAYSKKDAEKIASEKTCEMLSVLYPLYFRT